MVPRGENGERDTLGGWHSHVYINTDTTDNPQGPTVEHGNATQHWQVLYGKGTSKRIYVYIHVYIYIYMWAGVTVLEPEQTWVKLGELGRMGQQRSPFGRRVPGPLCMGPRSPDPGGSSSRWAKPTTRKGGRALRTEELWKSPWSPSLLVLEFLPPASCLMIVPPIQGQRNCQHCSVAGAEISLRGCRVRGKKYETQTLGCLFWHILL